MSESSRPTSPWPFVDLQLPDEDATEHLGALLAQSLPKPAGAPLMLYLRGDLGAGKTTLARALLRRLGVEGRVRSPTYALVERYPLPDGEIAHLDLYRLADPDELEFLGLDELRDSARLWLVEWPQRGGVQLPAADLIACLTQPTAQSGRGVELRAATDAGAGWLRRLSAFRQQTDAAGRFTG